jgi:hypothetical protein
MLQSLTNKNKASKLGHKCLRYTQKHCSCLTHFWHTTIKCAKMTILVQNVCMTIFSLHMKIRTAKQKLMKFCDQEVYWTSTIDTIQLWLKSNSNNSHITWRTYMHFCIHLKHNSVKFIKEKNERHFMIQTLFPLVFVLFKVTKQNIFLRSAIKFYVHLSHLLVQKVKLKICKSQRRQWTHQNCDTRLHFLTPCKYNFI